MQSFEICVGLVLILTSLSPAQTASNRLEILNDEAHKASERGDIDGAAQVYRKMLALAPQSAAVHNNLGLLLFNAGRYEEALPELQRAHALEPKNATVTALLGMDLSALHRDEAALAALEPLTASGAAAPEVESTLADLLMAKGDYFSAVQHLRRLEIVKPSADVDYREQLCYVALAAAASAHLERTAPDSYFLHALRGQALSERGDYRAALPELQRALALDPEQRGAHTHIADVYWITEDWTHAEAEYQEELRRNPHDCYTVWKLANTHMQLRDPAEQILPLLEDAVGRCPKLTVARKDRGITYMRVGRNAEAVADLKAASERDPDEPSIHFQLSKAYAALQRTAESEKEMQRFAELEQQSHNAGTTATKP